MEDTHIHQPGIVIVKPVIQGNQAIPPKQGRVDEFGSPLEQDAVHAANNFKRKGIAVRESRAS